MHEIVLFIYYSNEHKLRYCIFAIINCINKKSLNELLTKNIIYNNDNINVIPFFGWQFTCVFNNVKITLCQWLHGSLSDTAIRLTAT